ncbi:MAG: hypothetical protein HYX74_02185 [Acidobacteria bacterium]|nr:hypothetical protein [Acidobacteriota bacterium]
MSAARPVSIVFAEEDTLFRLMEMALLRRSSPQGVAALHYFFGPDISSPLAALESMAGRLGLVGPMQVVVCSSRDALDAALPSADILVVEREPISREDLRAGASRLRFIQKFGRDCGNIDLAAASELGMAVASLVRVSSLSSADNVMALLLALSRNLIRAHHSVLARRDASLPGRFETGPARTQFNWSAIGPIRILAEQTLGLVGLGENSGEVARRARAFGMRVIYTKRRPLSAQQEAALGGVYYHALDDLLAQSDFVSLHVPYGPQTEKLVSPEFLARMKKGACLVNTSRGGVVDETALYEALRSGCLGGAALDVYRYEPVPRDCPLLDLDNVVWTPHISGGEPGFMLREVEDVLANICRVLRGDPPAGLAGGMAATAAPPA